MLKHTLAGLLFLISCGDDAAPIITDPVGPPSQPASIHATGGNAQVVVSWLDTNLETHYRVEYRLDSSAPWTLLQEVPANTTSAAHTTAQINVTYSYRVAACNTAGCSGWAETTGKWMPPGEPPLLTSLTIDSIAFVRAHIIATARSGGAPVSFNFSLSKAGETVPFATQQLVSAPIEEGQPSATVEAILITVALQPGTDYVIGVTASNQHGASPPIATKAFKTKPGAPPTMRNLRNSSAFNPPQPAFRLDVSPNGYNTEIRLEMVRAGESFATPIATANLLAQKEWAEWPSWDVGLPTQAEPGVVYKWRAIATNAAGTTVSDTVQYIKQ
jgi:hypothetical protein